MVYQGKEDQVTVVAAGVTLHEALAAAEHLKKGTELYVLIMRRKKNYICLKSQIGLFYGGKIPILYILIFSLFHVHSAVTLIPTHD